MNNLYDDEKKFRKQTTYPLLFVFFLFGIANFFLLDDPVSLLENFTHFKIIILSNVFLVFAFGFFITISTIYIGRKIDRLTEIIKAKLNNLH